MRIGLLSDTHGFLDDAIFRYFGECDELWHAGDFGPVSILEQLQKFKPTRAVYGNIDGAEIRSRLPPRLSWHCQGLPIYMTHAGGYPGRYQPGIRKELLKEKPALFVCGDSHILRVMRDPHLQLLHMNPGACGHHGWHAIRTLLRFTIHAGQISAVEAIELGPRGRAKTAAKSP